MLLARLTSPVVPTRTVSVTLGTAPAATPTVRANGSDAPAAIGPAFVHVTTCPTAAQVHPAPATDVYERPAGSVSTIVIAAVVAADPTLLTPIVYVPGCPTVKLAGVVAPTARSTTPLTVVGASVALLFAGLLSPGVDTDAVLVTVGIAAAATPTVSVTVLCAPAAIGPASVQLTAWPVAVQVHPAPATLVYESPAGSVSAIVIAPVVAADPTFDTTSV